MVDDNANALARLLDREAIRDCMARYCRGIDRRDATALRSTYWPDATDQHGPYCGDAEGFVGWAMKTLLRNHGSVHTTGTQLIEWHGSHAAVETYFMALQRDERRDNTMREVALWGRYLDLFEKRGQQWRIRERTVVYDWMHDLGEVDGDREAQLGPRLLTGRHAPDDPSYTFLSRVGDADDYSPSC